jgi:hypothetical protein
VGIEQRGDGGRELTEGAVEQEGFEQFRFHGGAGGLRVRRNRPTA